MATSIFPISVQTRHDAIVVIALFLVGCWSAIQANKAEDIESIVAYVAVCVSSGIVAAVVAL